MLHHLTYCPSPFYISYFLDRALSFCLGWPQVTILLPMLHA
jgi:hypothetical protein